MELIEGKWYRCKKTYYGLLGKSKFIIFREGYLYQLYPKGIIAGEDRHGVNLGQDLMSFNDYFYETPFDENTGPYPPAQPLFELLPGRRYVCKKSLKMNLPGFYTAFYKDRVYKASSKKHLIDEKFIQHELSSDRFDEHFEPAPLPISVSEVESSIPGVLNFYDDVVPLPIEGGKFYSLDKGATVSILPQYPKVMEVFDFPDSKPLTRVVFMEKNGRFFVWNNAQTLEEAEKEIGVSSYKFAREISPIVEVTRQEIADWKGVDVDNILIIQ